MDIKIDASQIANGIIAQILATFFAFVLGLIFLDKKNLLAPWIYRMFGAKTAYYFRVVINFIVNPLFRIGLILISLVFINLDKNVFLFSVFIILLSISLLWKNKITKIFNPIPKITDDFDNLDNWTISKGSPEIESNFGKPAPDLILKYIPKANEGTRMNSLIFHKNLEVSKGIIECDFYLENNAILNILFFSDFQNENWYMARFDSREVQSDGFLIKDKGTGFYWRELKMSGTHTQIKKWFRARIEFDENKASIYRDDELIIQMDNPQPFGKSIGMFNELADVHIDNFSFIDKS